jgi:hypothetical protein
MLDAAIAFCFLGFIVFAFIIGSGTHISWQLLLFDAALVALAFIKLRQLFRR